MQVYWLEQTGTDVPAGNHWLGASEAMRLERMRFAKRRADWRLGRWAAKHALALHLNLPLHPVSLARIEIRPEPSGAPEVFLDGQSAALTISLTHRDGRAACAVAPFATALGCDLELIEPRSDAFIADYFTAEEQALVARAPAVDRPRLLALLWSGKESALKALRTGLRLDTRCVIVTLVGEAPQDPNRKTCVAQEGTGARTPAAPMLHVNGWRPLIVRCFNGQVFYGWSQHAGDLVRTVVAAPPPDSPMLLPALPDIQAFQSSVDDPLGSTACPVTSS